MIPLAAAPLFPRDENGRHHSLKPFFASLRALRFFAVILISCAPRPTQIFNFRPARIDDFPTPPLPQLPPPLKSETTKNFATKSSDFRKTYHFFHLPDLYISTVTVIQIPTVGEAVDSRR